MFILQPLESRRLLSISLSANTWTPIGPSPVGNGQTPGSLSVSGRIYEMAISPANPNQLYAATGGGGVWGSADDGATWTPLTDSQATLFTGSIAIAPSNANVIYAGTGSPTVITYAYTGRGILKSSDGGGTWSMVGAGTFNRETISKIVVSPTDPNTVYAAVSQAGVNGTSSITTGIFKSTNGGITWTNTTASISTSDSFTDLAIDPTNGQTLYCSVGTYFGDPDNGVYKSTDGGATWNPAGNFLMGRVNGWTKLAISASSPQVIYASVAGSYVIGDESLGTLFHLYRSGDGGATWTTLSHTPDYLQGAGEFASALTVSPTDPNTLYAAGYTGTNSVIRSANGGQSWSDISTGTGGTGPHMLHHGLVVDSTGRLLDADDGGAFRYDPLTNQWSSLNATLNITQLNNIALDPSTPNTAWAGAQDNGTDKFTGGLSWSQKRQTNGGVVLVDPTNPSTVYHEYMDFGTSGFIERSTDGGTTWSSKTSGISTSDSVNLYPPLAMDPSTSTRLIVGTNRVYLSTNRGDSWSAISTTNTNGWTTDEPIDTLAIAKTSANTIYASADGNVYVTTNGGSTWTLRNPIASPADGLTFSNILIDPTNAQVAYIVAANFSDLTGGPHVWKTTNAGATWTNISGNLADMPVWSIALDPSVAPSGAIYIGTDAGVYRSIDGGATWATFGSGLPNAQVRDIEFNASMNLLAAGTYGRGMWEISMAPAVTAQAFNDDAAPFKLTFQFSQNVKATLTEADLQVTDRVNGGTKALQLVDYNTTTNVATFQFTDDPSGTLPDGEYRAVLSSAGVTNASGVPLAADVTLDFFHYSGDANHDRNIDGSDFTILAANFGRPGATFSQGDFNYDGSVNALDFNILATHFGTPAASPGIAPLLASSPVANLFSDETINDLRPWDDLLG